MTWPPLTHQDVQDYIDNYINSTAPATYPSMTKQAGQDTMRATRDRAYRTWDAQSAPGLFIYGHSVVDGTGASDSTHTFAYLLGAKVAGKRPGTVSTSEGHGGYTTAQLLANLPGTFASRAAGSVGCVVLMGMLNDAYYGVAPATTAANLTSIISGLRAHASAAPHMAVVLAVEWERIDVALTVPWSQYVTAAQGVADADPYTTVVDLGARMGGPGTNDLGLFAADGAHPSDVGHALVASLLDAELVHGQGTAAGTPSTAIFAAMTPFAQTGWNGVTRDTDGALMRYSDAAQNDSISYQFLGDAGHYSIAFDFRQQPNAGIYDLYIDGVLQGAGGQWDGYAAANTVAFATVGGFLVPTSGVHTLRLVMASKNASSSGYTGVVRGLFITRTGA